MRLALNPPLQRRLQGWACAGYPRECCGLLLGHAGDGVVRVEEIVQAHNVNAERGHDRYEIDPEDFLHADALARERRLEIVGIWHTHPDHPARPSATDREQAWEGWSYLIVSVNAAGVQAMRSWRLDGHDFIEEALRNA
jgi:proteasome lid subunit RPN8/RPN11